MSARVLMLDTETTGFSPVSDRIVEFAAVEMEPRTGRTGRAIHHLIDPQRSIPEAAARVHGITRAQVRHKPRFAAIADGITEFVRGSTMAIHNSAFDVRMLDAELQRAGRPTLGELNVTVIDTLAVAKDVYPLLPRHSLDALCDHVGVSRAERAHHGALTDARLLGACVSRMSRDYDRWVAAPETDCDCGAALAALRLQSYCAELEAQTQTERAEKADEGLSRLATAMHAIAAWSGALTDRCSAAIGERDWSCKHFVVQWIAGEHTSWRAAAVALVDPARLDGFRKQSSSRSLIPATSDAVAAGMHDFDDAFARAVACRDTACSVATMVRLDDVAGVLASRRETVRKAVLELAGAGYAPRFAHLRSVRRNNVDYRRAVRALAPDADLAAFRTTKVSMRVRRRNPEACGLLFR